MENKDFKTIVTRLQNREISREEAKVLLDGLRCDTKSLPNTGRQGMESSAGQQNAIGSTPEGIAVVGMSGIFPDAGDVNSFWENLLLGHDAIHELPTQYLDQAMCYSSKKQTGKTYCKWGGILAERDCFDPLFFSITPREAESMNPHQRLVLQESWKALEEAGYNPKALTGSKVGIFIGAEPTGYFHESFTGSSDAIVASRLSYYLNLKGPALVINTGCSSSAAALHLACESLRNKESSLAIAGGVFAKLEQSTLVALSQMDMISPSGQCRTFDESADGTVLSEGIGVVVLKPLKEAISDRDHIYGVIKASGMNQDGASNGITAPNGTAQENLLVDIYRRYGINPEGISYIEAHGTGTKLGDPVEANALVRAFRQFTNKEKYCLVGSIKSAIGHTGATAGVLGLINILLCLKHHKLPGLKHFKKLNPLIDFNGSAFYLRTEPSEWKHTGGKPLMAALNSFGHSGTNVHLVVEEYIAKDKTVFNTLDPSSKGNSVLIPLSAKNKIRLKEYAGKLLEFIKSSSVCEASGDDSMKVCENSYEALVQRIRKVVSSILQVQDAEIEPGEDFSEYGMEQSHRIMLVQQLQEELSIDSTDKELLYRNSITSMADYLAEYCPKCLEVFRSPRPKAGTAEARKNDSRIKYPAIDLSAMAYTLQIGREAMEERVIFLVNDIHGLVAKLEAFLMDRKEIEDCWQGQESYGKKALNIFSADSDMGETVARWIEKGQLRKIAELWSQGFATDWSLFYKGDVSPRISLPTYPFSRERFWMPEKGIETGAGVNLMGAVGIHPLVHQNTSDLSEYRFSSTFTGAEFFLADHVVQGQRILPGVAYLEMARAAVSQLMGASEAHPAGIKLTNIVWIQPITVAEQPVRVQIGLSLEADGRIFYEIYSNTEEDEMQPFIHSQGNALPFSADEAPTLDIEALKAQFHPSALSAGQLYEIYKSLGFHLGTGFQGVDTVYASQGQVLAKLCLPSSVSGTKDQFVLHPSMMDSALQASMGLLFNSQSDTLHPSKPALPFALEEIEIFAACAPEMWAWIQPSEGHRVNERTQKMDIHLCDSHGRVCVRMKGFTTRVLENKTLSAGFSPARDMLLLEPCWEEKDTDGEAADMTYERHLAILCGLEGIDAKSMENKMKGTAQECRFLSLPSKSERVEEYFQDCAVQVFEEIQSLLDKTSSGKTLIQIVISNQSKQLLLRGLSGFLKTVRLENPQVTGQLIIVEAGETAEGIRKKLEKCSRSPMDMEIRYKNGKCLVAGWSEIKVSQGTTTSLPWREQGVYLITGGAGGLGLIFAEEIARKTGEATLILVGRSDISEEKRIKLEELEALGAKPHYRQVDVTRKEAVEALIQGITREFGTLHGIIHSAGIISDSFIIRKNKEEILEVLAPKVSGVVNLDMASKDICLDFFVFFSSLAGGLGNIGQADYAAANAFMDAYAAYRSKLAAANQRQGQTLSINWPLWKEGGMHLKEKWQVLLEKRTGMIPLTTENGVRAFYQCLTLGREQVLVIEGSDRQIKQKLLSKAAPSITETLTQAPSDSSADKVQEVLLRTAALLFKLKTEEINVDTELGKYGLDSISFTEFANHLNGIYALELAPTLFFEYPTLRCLAKYLSEEYPHIFATRSAPEISKMPEVESRGYALQRKGGEMPIPPHPRRGVGFTGKPAIPATAARLTIPEPIAIVGISGIFPQAKDIPAFWENLAEGRDCISEIPKDRWDWKSYYGDPFKEANKTNIKWGGFIEGVDEFDPLFFGISPKEAELMDPQQRLLMTYVWKVIEDAGYSPQSLSGTQTAIFVGTTLSGYNGLISRANIPVEAYSSTGMAPSVGPNRMSYFLNLHGPSEPIETACSSSLIALHRAVSAITDGTCNMAIAGGVNTLITPEVYISFSKAGMLCEDGRCKAFSDKANGYVRGEGVGMLFLKKLSDAEAAGDHIYGLIRGTAENHGGRASSLTAPNPKAQVELLVSAYTRSGIDPRTVSYIEAHGTGTELGDPIEINSLKAAFKKLHPFPEDSATIGPRCGIGSVKTNIGHLELAAGVAGVIKVLLQFKYKTLVKSLHCDTLNPYIHLEDSPFYIVRETEDWKAIQDESGRNLPRRAGVSSFGFGGANAHIVLEEYIPPNRDTSEISGNSRTPAMIVLSARNEKQLKDQAQQLLHFIRKQKLHESSLQDIAYTLQVGRDAMEERLGILTESMQDLEEKLLGFVEGKEDRTNLYYDQVRKNREIISDFSLDKDLQNAVDSWIYKGKYEKLLGLWVKGLAIDWNKVYPTVKPRRISLPTYPFAKERYWVPETENPSANERTAKKDTDESLKRRLKVRHTASRAASVPEASEIMTFEEVWQEEALKPAFPLEIKTLICFLSGRENQETVAETLKGLNSEMKVIFIARETAYRKHSREEYGICTDTPDAYIKTFNSIRQDYGEADAIIYLWAFEDTGLIQEYSEIFHILHAVAAAKLPVRRLLLAAQFETELERCYLDAWGGFERSLGRVMPNTQTAVICQKTVVQEKDAALKDFAQKLWAELQTQKLQSALYQNGKRHVCRLHPVTLHPGEVLLKPGGTYLITGGCGGLGFLFAQYFAQKYSVNLILTGRSPVDAEKRQKIKALEAMGSRVLYVQSDVCDSVRMREELYRAQEHLGKVHGVIHAAGISSRENILAKDILAFEQVLSAKISGTLVLDEIFREASLDFVCYFSSSSAILGDFGSCDYAIGNRFQLAFAQYLPHKNKVLAIQWPLWNSDGMQAGDMESTETYLKSSGQRLLEKEEGFTVFERILAQKGTQHLVLVGQNDRIRNFLGLNRESAFASPVPGKGRRPEMKDWSVEQCLEWDLKELIHQLLKISRASLGLDENLTDFGFDSISLGEFAKLLTCHYEIEITPSLFYGHSTIGKLLRYFLKEHSDILQEFYKEPSSKEANPEKMLTAYVSNQRKAAKFKLSARASQPPAGNIPPDVPEPIAIIGMSGRFPEARNIDEMWKILIDGRNTVKEVPSDRWDWRQYGGNSGTEHGKISCKWCGCIPGVREFDPQFFEISPKEATLMDPRQRLLLQEAWKALEDAGYGAAQVKHNRIGMFVGVEQGEYQWLVKEKGSITSNHNAVLASRLAYFLNLNGPVMAIDTACSSGLVAAHQAILSLRCHECDTAIAAGINLMLIPETFAGMEQAGMLSPDGKCFTFDQRANGLAPGEAVSAVVFKRLSQARADGDPIYAVVTGSGVNYDGKTNGITAPSGVAQTELIRAVYTRYKINPEEIEYVVTHGTGTKLGDPVEVNALRDAFKAYTQKCGYLAVTSTKTNFGHTFAASGLVSLICLVQALRHRVIPPSLHCEQENPYIHWKDSPFYVNKSKKLWPGHDGKNRMGAVSAFGMSGTNAHMVVQSFCEDTGRGSVKQSPYHVLALSAKTQAALQEKLRDLIAVLEDKASESYSLSQISYTLLEGRQHFNFRCAVVVRDRCDAIPALKQAGGNEKLPNVFKGQVVKEFTGQKAMYQLADHMFKEVLSLQEDPDRYRDILLAFADLYCQGYELDWKLLYGDSRPYRIHLPTYPFAREHYWIPQPDVSPVLEAIPVSLPATAAPVPDTAISETFGGGIKEKPRGIPLRALADKQTLCDIPIAVRAQEPAAVPAIGLLTSEPTITDEAEDAAGMKGAVLPEDLQEDLAVSLAEALYMKQSEVEMDKKFIEMGLDSIIGVEWIKEINKRYGTSIGATRVYDYPTLMEFSVFLAEELNKQGKKMKRTAAKPPVSRSVYEVLEQVYQGTLDPQYADRILSNHIH